MLGLSCYSIIKNECDGRCQSCGMCPLCDDHHAGLPPRHYTRWDHFKYVFWRTYIPAINPRHHWRMYKMKKGVE